MEKRYILSSATVPDKISESEGVDHEITGNSLKARSRGKRIDRAYFFV